MNWWKPRRILQIGIWQKPKEAGRAKHHDSDCIHSSGGKKKNLKKIRRNPIREAKGQKKGEIGKKGKI